MNHEHYDPEEFRPRERLRSFLALNAVSSRPGPASKLVENSEDHAVYLEGVMTALGLHNTDVFKLQTDTFQDAMSEGDSKTLRIFAEAAEDVRRAREEGISVKAKHVASLITAKLELESQLGFLPSEAAVKRRAAALFRHKFEMDSYDLQSDSRSWREAISAAGLGYLSKRGEIQGG